MQEEMSSDAAIKSPAGDQGQQDKVLLQDPAALAGALEESQEAEVANFMESLPAPVRRRVNALKRLQLASLELETEFFKQLHELECTFVERAKPLYEKRAEIIKGEYEPTDAECQPVIHELEKDIEEKMNLDTHPQDPSAELNNAKGVPEFWLTAMRNSDLVAEMIEAHDEPILKHLTNIELLMEKEPMSFSLIFHFSPNEFFTNTTLTKVYNLKVGLDPNDPLSYDGPELLSCKGCKIDWKPGHNVTVKLIKKKVKHKKPGGPRFVTKEIKNESFFNFFDSNNTYSGRLLQELEDDVQEQVNDDFEVAQTFRDHVIPHAVLYFTGEAMNDEDDFDEEEGDEDEDYEYSEDEEEEEEESGAQKGTNKPAAEKPEECKQQ